MWLSCSVMYFSSVLSSSSLPISKASSTFRPLNYTLLRMYQRKVNVDMLNAVTDVSSALALRQSKQERSKRQPTHSLLRSAYPHQPYIDTLYVLPRFKWKAHCDLCLANTLTSWLFFVSQFFTTASRIVGSSSPVPRRSSSCSASLCFTTLAYLSTLPGKPRFNTLSCARVLSR